MSLAAFTAPADNAGLDELLKYLPGGKWIAPHAHEGPFWLVVITNPDKDNWRSTACLDAYPGMPFTVRQVGDDFPATVHAVPDFIKRMLEWEAQPDYGMNVEDELGCGPYEAMPGPAELLEALPGMLDLQDEQARVEKVLTEAGEQYGAERVLRLILALDQNIRTDADALTTAVTGTLSRP